MAKQGNEKELKKAQEKEHKKIIKEQFRRGDDSFKPGDSGFMPESVWSKLK